MTVPPAACVIVVLAACAFSQGEPTVSIDRTTYNAGSMVRVKISGWSGTPAVRYTGEQHGIFSGVAIAPKAGDGYASLWTIPRTARTRRYEIDITSAGNRMRNVASFAVHRKLAQITRVGYSSHFG